MKPRGDELESLAFSRDEVWLTAQNEAFEGLKADLPRPTREAIQRFRDLQGAGAIWKVSTDRVTGRPSLMEGSGILWIPGSGNGLTSDQDER